MADSETPCRPSDTGDLPGVFSDQDTRMIVLLHFSSSECPEGS